MDRLHRTCCRATQALDRWIACSHYEKTIHQMGSVCIRSGHSFLLFVCLHAYIWRSGEHMILLLVWESLKSAARQQSGINYSGCGENGVCRQGITVAFQGLLGSMVEVSLLSQTGVDVKYDRSRRRTWYGLCRCRLDGVCILPNFLLQLLMLVEQLVSSTTMTCLTCGYQLKSNVKQGDYSPL